MTGVTAPAALRFGPIDVAFDETVLRPRLWTLAQSIWAAELSGGAPILELGCGAGHIGLAAGVYAGAHLVQVDRELAACRWAARNAAANGCEQQAEQRCGRAEDILGVGERYRVVIADPPYVPSDEVGLYPEDPPAAIDGGPDGLHVVRSFLTAVARHVEAGGSVVLQLRGLRQAAQLEGWLARPASPALAVAEARSYGDVRALARLEVTAGAA